MRWHLLATDKIYLQLKGFDKIPTDNREIWRKPLSVLTIDLGAKIADSAILVKNSNIST